MNLSKVDEKPVTSSNVQVDETQSSSLNQSQEVQINDNKVLQDYFGVHRQSARNLTISFKNTASIRGQLKLIFDNPENAFVEILNFDFRDCVGLSDSDLKYIGDQLPKYFIRLKKFTFNDCYVSRTDIRHRSKITTKGYQFLIEGLGKLKGLEKLDLNISRYHALSADLFTKIANCIKRLAK